MGRERRRGRAAQVPIRLGMKRKMFSLVISSFVSSIRGAPFAARDVGGADGLDVASVSPFILLRAAMVVDEAASAL